jgi:Tfp pilus assembly protein PilN
MPKNKAINLLPQEEFNVSTSGRILKWATGTFRIIVIATEMVVMAAFLSRFWLDAQNSNLNNSIKAKSAQISAQENLEKQFREIQSKLNIFNKISLDQNTSKFVDKITGVVPANITLLRASIAGDTIEIRGTSLSYQDLTQFLTNLQTDPFKKVELGQVNSSEINLGEINFVISITY